MNTFFFNDPATTEIYTLSLHDALPILSDRLGPCLFGQCLRFSDIVDLPGGAIVHCGQGDRPGRSEEHTSELQSLAYLVCRLLLEKKKKIRTLSRLCAPPRSTFVSWTKS